jgi:hypothetical protein
VVSREIKIDGDVAYVPLTRGYQAVIDAADVPLVEKWRWSALVSPRRKAVYAARVVQQRGVQRMILMHRLLLEAVDGKQADHIDGDGLNNRRSNLRLCTHRENQQNKGPRSDNKVGIKGVCWDKKAVKWKAEIRVDGRGKFLGYFATAREAGAAYQAAAQRLHGPFARRP